LILDQEIQPTLD